MCQQSEQKQKSLTIYASCSEIAPFFPKLKKKRASCGGGGGGKETDETAIFHVCHLFIKRLRTMLDRHQ